MRLAPAVAASDADAIHVIVHRVRERAHAERIMLFGSRATGRARHDSDYDLLIVGPEDEAHGRLPAS